MDSTQCLLTYEEAADRLGMTVAGIRYAVRAETLKPVLVKGRKLLKVSDVDTYHRRKGRHSHHELRQEAAPTAEQATPPASLMQQSPEEVLRLARGFMESGDEAMRDGLREHASGVIASRVAILQTLLGNGGGYSDPKELMRSLIA